MYCSITLYHIFKFKYRCFVYALSMIVQSLYRTPRPISYGCLLRRLCYTDRFSEVHLFLNEANNVL